MIIHSILISDCAPTDEDACWPLAMLAWTWWWLTKPWSFMGWPSIQPTGMDNMPGSWMASWGTEEGLVVACPRCFGRHLPDLLSSLAMSWPVAPPPSRLSDHSVPLLPSQFAPACELPLPLLHGFLHTSVPFYNVGWMRNQLKKSRINPSCHRAMLFYGLVCGPDSRTYLIFRLLIFCTK
jgi:hypothetical protein